VTAPVCKGKAVQARAASALSIHRFMTS